METCFQLLKDYVCWSEDDAGLILAFRATAALEFPRIAQRCCDKLAAHCLLNGEALDRFRHSLLAWLPRLCGGIYDQAYADETLRMHSSCGVPQHGWLLVLAATRSELNTLAERRLEGTGHETRAALDRVLDLEFALWCEGYRESLESQARQAERLENEPRGRTPSAAGTLAARLAHEMRNPLNGAQLHVAFLERALKKRAPDAELLEAVKVVGEEIKRLAVRVTEFLNFARARPEGTEILSLQKFCEGALAEFRSQAERAKVELALELPASPVQLKADDRRIDQLLRDLLRNALEAQARRGGGQVVLRARHGAGETIFEVEDDGPSPQAPATPIFDAFFATKSPAAEVGSAAAQRTVSEQHGSIDVESRSGRRIFRFSLSWEATASERVSRGMLNN